MRSAAVARVLIETDQAELAEQSLLGGLLLDSAAWDRVADAVNGDDFSRREHRLIFNAVSTLCKEGKPADAITVSDWLERSGELEAAGGLAYLGSLANNTPSAANVLAYAELVQEHGERRRLIERIDRARTLAINGDIGHARALLLESPRSTGGLRALNLQEILELDLPPRENLLDHWLPRQGLVMIYAPRGIGKTWVSLWIAYAVASGSSCLRWRAPKPAGVLYVDGEMPAIALQERLATIAASADGEPQAPLQFVTPDLQPHGMPDLSTPEGQRAIDAMITPETALIVVDNLSTLVRSGKENEAEGWTPVQAWALRHRAQGRSVLFVHHAGKGGQQRGTSRREDILDTVISLRRPPEYSPKQGAVFEVHFEKARGIHGEDAEPFEAMLGQDASGRQVWTTRSIEHSTAEKVATLLRDGLNQQEIAEELGLHKSNVSRAVKRAKASGLNVKPATEEDEF